MGTRSTVASVERHDNPKSQVRPRQTHCLVHLVDPWRRHNHLVIPLKEGHITATIGAHLLAHGKVPHVQHKITVIRGTERGRYHKSGPLRVCTWSLSNRRLLQGSVPRQFFQAMNEFWETLGVHQKCIKMSVLDILSHQVQITLQMLLKRTVWCGTISTVVRSQVPTQTRHLLAIILPDSKDCRIPDVNSG